MIKKALLVFFLFATNTILSQEFTQRLRVFNRHFIDNIKIQQHDSVSFYLRIFLANDDLTPYESQMGYFNQGVFLNSIARTKEAIISYEKSLSFSTGSEKSIRNGKICKCNLSDAYFTEKNYEKAHFYAQSIINEPVVLKDPNSYINLYTITGYYNFLKLEYDKSLHNYDLAEKKAKKEMPCKLPEIYLKRAKVYSRINNFYKAKKTIDQSLKICDSCNDNNARINSLKALREILTENGKYEEANAIFNKVDELYKTDEIRVRNKKVDSLETIFKTKLKEAQNISLKKTNIQKEKENKTQRLIILATIIGIFILGLLLFYVIKLSKKEKESNHLLTKQKLDLERLNLLNQKIFSVISHDFKGPMINLELLLKLDAKKMVSEAEYTLQKQKLSNDLTQANLIMDNLLGWAKNELRITVNTSQEANTYEACEAINKQLNYIFEEKNISLINEIPKDNSISISQDVLLIIFRNLISNALKFSFKDNDIIVSFNKNTNTYSVQDFGTGIPKNQLQKIFHTQTEATVGTNNEIGFGLGLNFVHEIIKQNNGTIWIESIENEGTIVYFKINGNPLTDNL
ncbi:HAMP domain-containing histidine kinase [Flavobacterium amnicola]|uniref:histidine kinase n=1 Tax=Flavobacterium amnicola TaxID=2506422 RepID=A0A4Q1K5Y4_9FLAO|nr:HAMP domain-containing sensor histidine kinase [Flavobacterium amnicola]RXR20584.1 HAMP domain-containing histidine kinase [Flavobacterium amnicola]